MYLRGRQTVQTRRPVAASLRAAVFIELAAEVGDEIGGRPRLTVLKDVEGSLGDPERGSPQSRHRDLIFGHTSVDLRHSTLIAGPPGFQAIEDEGGHLKHGAVSRRCHGWQR